MKKLIKKRIIHQLFISYITCILLLMVSSNIFAQEMNCIGGGIFNDLNNNGLQDEGETNRPNVPLVLLSEGNLIQTTTSNIDGFYEFCDLPSGDYTVSVLETTLQYTPLEQAVTLTETDVSGIDFAAFPYELYSNIGGAAYYDLNGNGIQDTNEIGIPDLEVILIGNGIEQMEFTDEFGQFNFPFLAAGEYEVRMSGIVETGSLNSPNFVEVSIEEGESYTSTQFIFGIPSNLGSVVGFVCYDFDEDGINDIETEPGIASVPINLSNLDGQVVATTATNANGLFSFIGIAEGVYTVGPSTELSGLVATTEEFSIITVFPGGVIEIPIYYFPIEPIFKCGQSVVTCYSGSDLSGHVIGMKDVRDRTGAPLGSNWSPPAFMHPQWKDTRMGEVFGIAIDRDYNVYASATKVYGVGGFGSAGAGGIYKIDAYTGAVSDFVTTGTGINQIPNSGVGLGNICYDEANLQLLVTNFEDGKIYSIAAPGNTNPVGNVLDTFDPFGIDNGNGCAALGEILWGIGIYNNRVYFSRWNQNIGNAGTGSNQIYSIGLNANGDFLPNPPTLEITLPPYSTGLSSPVSDIAFSADGKMLLSERGEGYCTNPGTGVHRARVLEYTFSGSWIFNQQFYVGELGSHANASGGVDYGYASFIPPAPPPIPNCDEFVWATGDALRLVYGQAIYGLAGIPATGNGNTIATLNSIHIDVDGDITYGDKTRIGDVEIFKCGCPVDPCDKEPTTKTFSTTIDSPLDVVTPPTKEICYTAYENKDGEYIVNANSNTFSSPSNIFLSSVDYAGNLIPSKQWYFTDNDTDVVYFNNPYETTCGALTQGNVATGYRDTGTDKDLFITLDDPFTNSGVACYLFQENDGIEQIGYSVTQDSQGHIIAVGSINDGSGNKVYAVSMDNCLNVKWIYDYTLAGSNSVAYSVTEVSGLIDPNTVGVLPRLYAITGQVDDDAFLLFIDPNTGLPITNTYQQYDIDNGSIDVAKSIIVDKNGNLVIAGTSTVNEGIFGITYRPFILQYFADGTGWQFSKINISGIPDANGNSIAENADGNLILTGTTFDDLEFVLANGKPSGKAYLMEIQNDLSSVLWANTYISAGFNRSEGKRVTLTSDNGILMAGTSYQTIPGPPLGFDDFKADVYLVKTDESGCLDNCDCFEPRTANTYVPQYTQSNHDILPKTYDLFDSIVNCEHVETEFAQNFCDQYCPDICQIESFLYPIGGEGTCCYALDLNNLDPDVLKIQIDINTPNVFFDQGSVSTGFNLLAYSSTSITIDNGGQPQPIPTGAISQYLTFCLGNTGNLITSQSFTIKYFDLACNEIEECEQNFETECELVCTDDICVRILDIDVECDPLVVGQFKFTFKIKNETIDKVLDKLDFKIVNPSTGAGLSTNSIAINPSIGPGVTSIDHCIDIFATPPFPKQVDLEFSASGYDINDPKQSFCCHDLKDVVSITLPDCCDPCEDTWVVDEIIPSIDGDCCYNLDIFNTCENRLSKIKATSLTNGVNLGAHWNPNYSSTWTFAPLSSQVVEWSPIGGGYAPVGSYADLIHFCLDNPLGVSNPQIMVEYIYINSVTGEEIVECEEILELECEIDLNCIDILEHEVYCDEAGNYYLYFCVDNLSTPYFNATELQIDKLSSVPGDIDLAQKVWAGLTPPDFPLCKTVQITGILSPPKAGDILNLEFRLKNLAADTCCVESDTLCIVLPKCCPQLDPINSDLLLSQYRTAMTCGVTEDFLPTTSRYTFGVMDNSQVLPVGTRTNFTGNALVTDYHHSSWHIDEIGNVFGITIDQEGYMYAAASANYGAGFWIYTSLLQYGNLGGGANDLGAAGTIYQMDKFTGQARVFAQLPQQPFNFTHENCEGIQTSNRTTGPGLGNIVYDPTHNQIFAANWEDGKIYRLDMNGNIVDSFDPQQPDNNDPGLPSFTSDVIPYGLAVTKDGTQLFFGTLYSGGQVISINLDPMGGFVGSAATGQVHYRFMQPNISVSDLEFLPNGDLLIGTRSGCNNNFASSYNHRGSSYILTPTGGAYNSISTQLPVSYDSHLPFNFLDGDDQYGGVAYAEYAGNQWEYVVSSSDILDETGPHGIAVIPQNFTGSPISQLAGIAYAPITNNSDMKGIGGDVQVFNPYCPFDKPEKSACCQSEMEFDERVEAGFQTILDTSTLVVMPNDLTDCHTVTWIWGDETPNGTSQGNAMAVHTYAESNSYPICMLVEEYDVNGNLCWSDQICETIVSAPSNDATTDFKVYPNPAQDYLTFEWQNVVAKSYQLAIFDLQGRIIWQQSGAATLEQKLEVDVKNFPTGIYGYHLQWEGGEAESGKFIKGL